MEKDDQLVRLRAKHSKLLGTLGVMREEIFRLRDVEQRNIVLEMRVNSMLNNGISKRHDKTKISI